MLNDDLRSTINENIPQAFQQNADLWIDFWGIAGNPVRENNGSQHAARTTDDRRQIQTARNRLESQKNCGCHFIWP